MANEAQMMELLNGLRDSDKTKRTQAQDMYKQAKDANVDQLIGGLLKVVKYGDAKQQDKTSALVYVRQLCNKEHSKDFRWPNLPAGAQQEIAQYLLVLFQEEGDEKVQRFIGNVLTTLADYVCDADDPRGWLVQGQSCGWPQLIPAMLNLANCQTTPNLVTVKNALTVLKDLVPSMKAEVVKNQAPIGAVLQASLACPELTVKTQGALLVCGMVEYLDKKDWAPLTATVPILINSVCKELARVGNSDDLDTIMQGFLEAAQLEPDFFKKSMSSNMEPADFFGSCVKTKEAESNIRERAMEWLATYAEKKPKWLMKTVPKFAEVALESCMALMLEIEDGQQELKEWAERMDDEEGEEDVDELFHSGEECIDRLCEALSMESIAGALFKLIGTFVQQPQWQAKHAALAAIKQTVEYVEESDHVKEMAKLLMSHVNHEHPRVRYTALHAIGQLANDQAPQFQEMFHGEVMPLLMQCMDDKVDRVAAMAMSAFVSFAEEMKDMLRPYSHAFMEKFLSRLQGSQHRGIQEESITAIAVVAAVLSEDFAQYYDGTMPLLKQIIMTAKDPKQQRLRGKAFECLSLLGVAVGKQKFLPDAQAAIEAMLSTSLNEDDEIQREYIKEAIERICHCLKKDFKVFLPALLPGIYKSLNIEEDAGLIPKKADASNNDEDDPLELQVGGKLVKVKTTKFEEMHSSVSMLNTFIECLEEEYFDYIQPTAACLLPILQLEGDAADLFEDSRGEAFWTWSYMIEAGQKRVKAGDGNARAVVQELLGKMVGTAAPILAQAQKAGEDINIDETAGVCSGLAECLKKAGPGYIDDNQVSQILGQLFSMLNESVVRSVKWKAKLKDSSAGVDQELAGDEDDEDHDPVADESRVQACYEEVMGGLMKAHPDGFAATHLQVCCGKMQEWMQNKDLAVVVMHLACDMLEHLKDKSVAAWPTFMPRLFEDLHSKDESLRIASAYAVNLAAQIPQFAEAAPEAYKKILAILNAKAPKKRDEKANIALDNAVAALFSLARHMRQQCPGDVDPFAVVLSKLPLKNDLEEAKKVHKLVVDLVQAQDAGLLGANMCNLGKILSLFAEIHKQEDTSDDELDAKIVTIFKTLTPDVLRQNASHFSEKQQKRVEKLISS